MAMLSLGRMSLGGFNITLLENKAIQFSRLGFFPRVSNLEVQAQCQDPQYMRDKGVNTYYPQGTVCYADPSQGTFKVDHNRYIFNLQKKLKFQRLVPILEYLALVWLENGKSFNRFNVNITDRVDRKCK